MTDELSVGNYREIIERFINAVDFDVPFKSSRRSIFNAVHSRLKAIPGWRDDGKRYIHVGYDVVRLMVPHLCDEAQIQVSTFYVLGAIIDDDPCQYMDGIVFDAGRLREIDHVGYYYAKTLFDSIERLHKWYEPFIVSMIWRSFFQWLVFLPHETRHADTLAFARSVQFIDYMRGLNVVADATSCVVFTKEIQWSEYIHLIPGMNLFVAEVNDLLSSYKELVVGEEVCSVIIQRHKLWGRPIELVVQGSCNTCIDTMKKLYSAPVSLELRKRLRQWIAGYVQFYLEVDRYRLKELLFGEGRGLF